MIEYSEGKKYVCRQEDCRFNQDGQCLEGLAIDQCPHTYILDEQDEERDDEFSIRDTSKVIETYALFSADQLTPETLGEVTNKDTTKLALIVGEPNSGKTTLLSTLYEQFQKGAYCNYLFCGSRTSIGFEKRCHKLRIESGLVVPSMDRTVTSDFHFLHLSVRHEALDRPAEHLLFADIAGERFSLARDSDEEAKRLSILNYTDQCFFLVDGEELASKSLRFAAKQRLQNLVGRFIQNDMLDACGGVFIIISKWDKVLEMSSEQEIENFFINPIKVRFKGKLTSIISLSAQPQTAALRRISGLDNFFQTCLINNVKSLSEARVSLSEDASQFQRFKFRKQ